MEWETSFFRLSQHLLAKDNLLTVLPSLTKEWRVTFEFYPTSYDYQGYAQILQITTGGKIGQIGDRTPALWIHNTRGVYVATTLGGRASVGKSFKTKKPPLNEWTLIEISQARKGSKYMFSLVIKGETLWTAENSDPRQFSDVKVYTSSAWYDAQGGYIRAFRIVNKIPGENASVSNKIKIKTNIVQF